MELGEILLKEAEALNQLLHEMENQYRLIVENNIFGLEACVEKIQNINIEIAKYEMERRKITGGESMSKIINYLGDSTLEEKYNNIIKLLTALKNQKYTNEILIKQGIVFSTQMLNIFSPGNRNTKTYNSYGKMR